jgi:hypothetical protein
MKKPAPTSAEEAFAATLRSWNLDADDFQEILRRMCRSLSDHQGNLLFDFLFVIDPKDRDKVQRQFIKLLGDELTAQHEYQHQHQGEQDPPTGKYAGVKRPTT